MKKSFHCRMVNGDPDFSIDDWNAALAYCNRMGIEGEERDKILNPEKFPCKKQCFDCMADVGDRRIKTKRALIKQVKS